VDIEVMFCKPAPGEELLIPSGGTFRTGATGSHCFCGYRRV
jgi:hypothetical protein